MPEMQPRWRNTRSGTVYDMVEDTAYSWLKRVRRLESGRWGDALTENIVEIDSVEVPTVAEMLGEAIDAEIEDLKEQLATVNDDQPGPIVSEPDTPNIQAYLRQMSYNVGTSMVHLAETVNAPGQDLYHLQVAYAMIGDEIRRLSEKEERSHG